MILEFFPQRRSAVLSLERRGDVLVVNGEAFDFSALPDGATLPRDAIASDWIAGDVERIDGVLRIPLILPHGPRATQARRFFKQIVDPADGPITLPPDSSLDHELAPPEENAE